MYGLSELYRQQGYDDKADVLICQGMRITSHFTDRNRNPNMYFRFRVSAEARIRELRSLARSHYDAEDYEDALQVIDQLEEFCSTHGMGISPSDLKLRAISLAHTGDLELAQHALRQLRIRYDVRECLDELDDLYETERFFVGKDHETSPIWDLLAQGQYEKASTLFGLMRKAPDFEAEERTGVMESLSKALTRQHGMLARSAKGRAEYDKAIHHYRTAIAVASPSTPLLNELAQLLATCPVDEFRNGVQAVSFARRLCEMTN